MEWVLVKTMLTLLAVVGVMIGCVLVLRRFIVHRSGGSSVSVEVELLGHRLLQPKCGIYVLRVLDKVIVVGTSDHGIRSIAEIDDVELKGMLVAEPTSKVQPTVPPTFAAYLRKQLAELIGAKS